MPSSGKLIRSGVPEPHLSATLLYGNELFIEAFHSRGREWLDYDPNTLADINGKLALANTIKQSCCEKDHNKDGDCHRHTPGWVKILTEALLQTVSGVVPGVPQELNSPEEVIQYLYKMRDMAQANNPPST
jgi:hypothetical protein